MRGLGRGNTSGYPNNAIVPVRGQLALWTPAITQSVGVTCTVTRATYQRVGRRITGEYSLACTSSGTASNAIVVTLPVAAASSTFTVGRSQVKNGAGTTIWTGDLTTPFSASLTQILVNSVGGLPTYVGSGGVTSETLVAGFVITGNFSYEAAADA